MKQHKYSILIVGILAFFSLSAFGQAGTITFSQYCAAGTTFTWPVNIREAKPVRITYAIDVSLNSDNFAIQEGSVNTYPVFMTNGYVTGSLCAGGTTGIVYISLYVNTAGYKTVTVQYCADNPIITKSNLNVGGNAIITGTATVAGKTNLNGGVGGNALGGALRVQSSYGYVDLGPQNSAFANIYTDRGEFAFDKPITLLSGTLASYTNTNLTFNTARFTTRMTILNSNGNVGIGVTDPQGVLQVRGTYDNSWIYFSSNAGMNSTKYKPKVGNGLAFTWNYSGGQEESIINYSGSSAARLDFTSWDGTNLATEMTLKKGCLGIGTTTPDAKLSVSGTIKTLSNPAAPWDNLSIWSDGENSYIQSNGDENGLHIKSNTANKIILESKVGIGVSNITTDALLTVNGTIHAKEVKVDLTGLADFVFDSGYKLMPLHQVESYVKNNSRLPDMPSASEVSKNGLSMGEMQNKLLQKVEELTLYVIELQKTNNQQSSKIEELEKKIK